MKQENSYGQAFWQNQLVRGSVLGASVLAVVSPGFNWTNHTIANKPFGWRAVFSAKGFTGIGEYAASAAPAYAVAFKVRAMLANQLEPTTFNQLLCTLAAGSAAGLATTPYEALAQNKQVEDVNCNKLAKKYQQQAKHAVLRDIIAKNGMHALFRGAVAMVVREGAWAGTFMFAPVYFNSVFKQLEMSERNASTATAFSFGAAFGFFSCPLHVMRFYKQEGLTEKKASPSYVSIAKKVYNEPGPHASLLTRVGMFLKGSKPRAGTAAVASTLLYLGSEAYDVLVKPKM